MSTHDPRAHGSLNLSLRPSVQTSAGTVNGDAVKVNTARWISLEAVLGVMTGTAPTATFKLQSSADGSSGWADVAGATTAAIPEATDDRIVRGTLDARKLTVGQEYVRAVCVLGGTVTAAPICASVGLSGADSSETLKQTFDFEVVTAP